MKIKAKNLGSAHGRFQPLHNEHLEYLLKAKENCEFLWVGITQYDIKNLFQSPKERHREAPFNNPLSYYERVEMITNVLIHEGLSQSDFGILPFPIETPDLLPYFLPKNIPIYTTICDDWNRHKINILAGIGYKVIVLIERENKVIEGANIRSSILRGDNTWKKEVPVATKLIIEKHNIQSRLLELQKGGRSII